MSQEHRLVPNRSCDQCAACCVTLRIEDNRLKKYADDPCPHLSTRHGCGIYTTRPSICRSWYCGWRYIQFLGDEWRPDRSNLLIRLHDGSHVGLILQPLESPLDVLTTRSVLDLVAACVEQSFPVFISVPGKEGHCHVLVDLSSNVAPAVESGDFLRARAVMVEAVDFASRTSTDPIAQL